MPVLALAEKTLDEKSVVVISQQVCQSSIQLAQFDITELQLCQEKCITNLIYDLCLLLLFVYLFLNCYFYVVQMMKAVQKDKTVALLLSMACSLAFSTKSGGVPGLTVCRSTPSWWECIKVSSRSRTNVFLWTMSVITTQHTYSPLNATMCNHSGHALDSASFSPTILCAL